MDTKEITEKLNLKCGVFAPLLAFGQFPADISSLIQTDKCNSNGTENSDSLFCIDKILARNNLFVHRASKNAMQQQPVRTYAECNFRPISFHCGRSHLVQSSRKRKLKDQQKIFDLVTV